MYPSAKKTAEWGLLHLAVRDKAFFSAGVDNAKILGAMKTKISEALNMSKRDPQKAFMSRDLFVREMKKFLGDQGYAVDGETLRDISSNKRLSLIYDFNKTQAHEYARFMQGQEPDLLNAFPAQELYRAEDRENRRDWESRWRAAGGRIFGGRMVALKTDSVWVKISRFGMPFPPYDFNSGMDVRDVSRKLAEQIGFVSPGVELEPNNYYLEESKGIDSLTADQKNLIKNYYGDQVKMGLHEAQSQSGTMGKFYHKALNDKNYNGEVSFGRSTPQAIDMVKNATGIDLEGIEYRFEAKRVRHADVKHGAGEKDATQRPLTDADFRNLPYVWKFPDDVKPGHSPDEFILTKLMNGVTYMVSFIRSAKNKIAAPKTVWIKK